VRRRSVRPASSSSSRRDDAEIVDVRPRQVRSEWTITEQGSATSIIQSSLSAALATLTQSALVSRIIELVQQVSNLLWPKPDSSFALDPGTSQLLTEFRDYTTARYDPTNPEHEQQLLYLWACSFPQETLGDRLTEQWKRLGFQGRDPATDFRGCGVFGLQQIVSYAQKYPEAFQFHLKGEHHEEAYPFAITAINLVNLIFQLLGWGMRPSTSPAKPILIKLLFLDEQGESLPEDQSTGRIASSENTGGNNCQFKKQTLDTFSEIFVATFHLFDKEWRVARANYMDFPKIVVSTQAKLEVFLQKNSLDGIIHFNYTNNMALSEQ